MKRASAVPAASAEKRKRERKTNREDLKMDPKAVLPKRLVKYIHETGVRALDNLSENMGTSQSGEPSAVQTLVNQWKSMSKDEKEQFVDRVAEAVVEVIA